MAQTQYRGGRSCCAHGGLTLPSSLFLYNALKTTVMVCVVALHVVRKAPQLLLFSSGRMEH
jgi:hypothetical protein